MVLLDPLLTLHNPAQPALSLRFVLEGLITKENPRLCRGGSRSLTVPAVAPQAPSTTLRRQATKHIDVPP
jgi:hypothetical protein